MNNTSPELRDALNAPLQQSGLTFTVQAAPFKHTQKDASVALTIEFAGDPLPFTPPDSGGLVTNTIELSFFGINQDGKAQRSTRSQFNLTLRPDSLKRVKTGGLRVNPRLLLEPGRYQIRVGARENVGSRLGTVFYDLQVPDFRKEPLMLSGVLITAASAQAAMTALPNPAAPKLLPGPAVSRRTFLRNDTVTVFAEIYDNQIHQAAAADRHVGDLGLRERARKCSTPATAWPTPRLGSGQAPTAGGRLTGWHAISGSTSVPPGRYLVKVEAMRVAVGSGCARNPYRRRPGRSP